MGNTGVNKAGAVCRELTKWCQKGQALTLIFVLSVP